MEAVEVEVFHNVVVKAHHEVEASLVFKHHASRLSGIGRADDGVEVAYVDAIACYASAVVVHHELRQANGLFDDDVGGARHLFHILCRLFCLGVQLVHILAVEFDGDVGLCAGHEFVEAQLNGLAEVKLRSLHLFQCRLHLLHHLGAARRRCPLLEWFHHDHHVGVLHRHRVGGHLSRTDLRHDMSHLWELLFQHLLGLL